ncbi:MULTISPECIES: hypothetical protein [unclassified Streptomyces]|uniref:hypothetical protein n=1 Tax=unclassified Streptomyces TaxID=2593676 RepID=UPI001BEA6D9E|nr:MULTISPECIES: hypothetical protein [unclassified Streptomyces]MBT2406933.1 hypothetical protein [Streptomyces sp. ISL-21]MBT2459049.1 hypothetical protein [Streptomyces sp. ISL-86]MBT2612374.1 hypothetical protein [Streptomyces sp. ISL-87]
MSASRAPMRTTRAAMFAAVCVALAAAGHSYMSGTDIPAMGLVGAFGVTGALAWLGAGRRRGPLGITAALLALQGVLHLVLSGSQAGHAGDPVQPAIPAPDAMAAHHMADMAGVAGVSGMGGMGGMAAEAPANAPAGIAKVADLADIAGHGGLGMIAAHVLAALFCAVWLAWGEAAVFRLAGALAAAALLAARPLSRALVLIRTHVAPVPPRPAFRRTYERPRRLRGAVHAHAVVRRGPPGRRDTRATAPGLPACL